MVVHMEAQVQRTCHVCAHETRPASTFFANYAPWSNGESAIGTNCTKANTNCTTANNSKSIQHQPISNSCTTANFFGYVLHARV